MQRDDAILPAVSLDDGHRPRLDHVEVALGVTRLEQDVTGLHGPALAEQAQAGHLTLVETGEGPITLRRLGHTGADLGPINGHASVTSIGLPRSQAPPGAPPSSPP